MKPVKILLAALILIIAAASGVRAAVHCCCATQTCTSGGVTYPISRCPECACGSSTPSSQPVTTQFLRNNFNWEGRQDRLQGTYINSGDTQTSVRFMESYLAQKIAELVPQGGVVEQREDRNAPLMEFLEMLRQQDVEDVIKSGEQLASEEREAEDEKANADSLMVAMGYLGFLEGYLQKHADAAGLSGAERNEYLQHFVEGIDQEFAKKELNDETANAYAAKKLEEYKKSKSGQ